MSFKQPPELYELQSDALGENLSVNPYMTASPISSKNKKLNTAKQFIVGAINELLTTIQGIKSSVNSSLNQQQVVLGDFSADPTLVTDLKKIDASVIKGLIKIYKDMCGDLDSPKDISVVAPSIKEAILKMSSDIDSMKAHKDQKDEYITSGPTATHEFLLTYKPMVDTIKLFVNGIKYDHAYDPETRLASWVFPASSGGFDLLENFKVEIVYDYLYAENI